MKTIIREMVETIKQLFAQKQQMQEPIVRYPESWHKRH